MIALPNWAKHPLVVAAFVAGLLAIIGPVTIQWILRPDVVVQDGGLFRDLYHLDGSWQAYVPQTHGRECFWVGLNVVSKKNVAVKTFSVGGVEFEVFCLGYRNQTQYEEDEMVRLTRGKGAWLSVLIQLDRWAEFRGILSSKTVCLLLDPEGKAVAKYELNATAFPQE